MCQPDEQSCNQGIEKQRVRPNASFTDDKDE
jgi:hypothetical protein